MAENEAPEIMRNYGIWAPLTKVRSWEMTRMRKEVPHLPYQPLISILVPAYNTIRPWLERALDSVLAQTYPHWELCVCDDNSTDGYVAQTLSLYERLDSRIKVKYSAENRGISGATNAAFSLAEGEFVGLLDHDDELAPNALFEVVKLLQERPDMDLSYSDENKIDGEGRRKNPALKIGWSPDLALSCNYMNHFSVYRRSLLEEVGGWREGFEGAQDLDLVQRFTEKTDRIFHIPKVLYHWREVSGSTAEGADSKPYTHERARRAYEESLERKGIAGSVKDGFAPNTFMVEREVSGQPLVSVIVFAAGESPETCIESLRQRTTYPNCQILMVDAEYGSVSKLQSSGEWGEEERLGGSTLAGLYNAAVRRSGGEYVLILSSGLEAASEDWLRGLLQHAQRPEVGAVGGKIMSPSGNTLEAGLILNGNPANENVRLYRPCKRQTAGFRILWDLNRNCSALSSECIMFRRSTFEEVGGFDEAHFTGEFADVDLCLRLRENGYLIVFTSSAAFTRHGSPHRRKLGPLEADYVRGRWGHVLGDDPYYNPHLSWRPDASPRMDAKPRTPGLPKSEAPHRDGSEKAPDEGKAFPAATPPAASRRTDLPPPFFIGGHGRSGTTWLKRILNSHTEIACKGEGMFFGRGRKLNEALTTLPNALAESEALRLWHEMNANRWDGRSFEEVLPGMVRALTDHVLETELQRSGKRIAGDKTPHHISHLEEVHGLYPEAKIVHVIRDGRDVAISNQHATWQNTRDKGGPIDIDDESLRKRDAYLEDPEGFLAGGESIFTERRIRQLARSWNGVVRRGHEDGRRLFGESYFEIHYESLLENPHPALEHLLAFLGADRDSATIERIVEDNSFEKVSGRSRGQESSSSFLRKGITGEWEGVFTERDREIFREEAGELLSELGYEKGEEW